MNTISGKVLLVSGDDEAGEFWAGVMRHRGADVTVARCALEALDTWEHTGFDLILIDAYPQLDGVALCRHLRSQVVNPILLLAPGGDEAYLLEGYRAGADECMLRSVGPAVVLAKVHAWLRHRSTIRVEALNPVEGGMIYLDPQRRQAHLGSGKAVSLTDLELRVLYLMMTHPGQVLHPEAIVFGTWGPDGGGQTPALHNVIYGLRSKIEPDPHHPRFLQTVVGKGYTFCA